MIPEKENFEELRRLLAIKRHEQPPPGYFQDFSRQVIARIKAGESPAGDSFAERLLTAAPWLRSLWIGFEPKSVVAGVFGVGVCSLLVVGLMSSKQIDNNPNALAPGAETPKSFLASVPSQPVGASFLERPAAVRVGFEYGSTNQGISSIFDEIKPHLQPVNFSVPPSTY